MKQENVNNEKYIYLNKPIPEREAQIKGQITNRRITRTTQNKFHFVRLREIEQLDKHATRYPAAMRKNCKRKLKTEKQFLNYETDSSFLRFVFK